MEQFFKLRNEKSWRSLLMNETTLRFVNMAYKSADEFNQKYEEKGLLKKRLEINISDINSIRHPKKRSAAATIKYNNKTDLLLNFDSEADRDQFTDYISKSRRMIVSEGKMNKGKALMPSLIGLAITVFFTWIVYEDAWVVEQGGYVDTSGRRSVYKKLFAWLGETLGTTGTLVAGGAIALICLYFMVKNLQSPPEEIVYEG